jgi:hypothetical protein
MRRRAHSTKPRIQAKNVNVRARAFKTNANSSKQDQCAGARMQTNHEFKHTRIHNNRELNQIRSMRGRASSKKPRTQANKVNARARAFENSANSPKHYQCEGARIQTIHELTQTRSMRWRAFNKAANSSKQCQCAGARIQQNRELKQRMSMCGRAHSKQTNSNKQYQCEGANIQRNRELKQTRSMRDCAL